MTRPHGANLRKGRCSEENRIYLVTTVTVERTPWFRDFFLGRAVVDALRHETERAETLAFVVMPDHLHWLVQLRHAPLSRVVANVKAGSARAVNRFVGREGPLWQKGFHDHAAREEEDVRGMARYLVANPLRAGLVESLREYPLWDAVWV